MTEYRDSRARPDPELERLAREGRAARSQAMDAATGDAQTAGDRHLREALAAVHGAPTGLGIKLAAGFCMMSAVVMILLHESVPAPIGVFTLALGIILSIASGVMSPRANDAALEAERTWYRALPFTLEGYFEVLSAAPRSTGGVRAHITWRGERAKVDEQLLADAFAACDPAARLEHADTSGAVFASGPIRGETGGRINHVPVIRNHRYPEYVHTLVEKVLVPLARSHPMESVRLEPT
jgi:hypothetical protein